MRLGNKGTTLLELTTTVAVLGVVTAMALPAFSEYTKRARANRAVGEISAISIELYRWRANVGNGSFPASLATAGIEVGPDPWGNAYSYLRLEDASPDKARHAEHQTPVNSDFDLYSMGPDGRSAAALEANTAHDDIIRAGDGAYIGVAAQY